MSIEAAKHGDLSAWTYMYEARNGTTAYGLRDGERVYTAYTHNNALTIIDGITEVYSGGIA